jgi:hypothetical protein
MVMAKLVNGEKPIAKTFSPDHAWLMQFLVAGYSLRQNCQICVIAQIVLFANCHGFKATVPLMLHSKKILHLILLSFFFFGSVDIDAQCSPESYCNECIDKLTDSKYNFLKSYKIDRADETLDRAEYSYVLTKATKYMINICSTVDHSAKIMLTIYDRNRTKVASNEMNGKVASAMIFDCTATGIYYLRYEFSDPSVRCAGSALGFTK